jgi:hypothetical protein
MAPRARAASKGFAAAAALIGASEAAREQIWHLSRAALGQLPKDEPAQTLLARMARAGGHARPDWDGVWRLTSK